MASVQHSVGESVPEAGAVVRAARLTAWHVVELTPGAWHTAISYRADCRPDESEEALQPLPLIVTDGDATPSAAPACLCAMLTLELQDVAFGGLEAPISAGPQVSEIANVGEQPRQVVHWCRPGPPGSEQLEQMMSGLLSGFTVRHRSHRDVTPGRPRVPTLPRSVTTYEIRHSTYSHPRFRCPYWTRGHRSAAATG